ncbi:hypothetical protein ACFWR9_32310 [Streptomyces sp. NPDC058534]|uniref:hypothetical protein n=1 Tax=Streptomyces sp. NPDC058534 TaxID=3346541 RepID=UPI00364AB8D3
MTMTIKVYRINPQTGARTWVRGKHTVRPAAAPELTGQYPPCICRRCTGRAADQPTEGAR